MFFQLPLIRASGDEGRSSMVKRVLVIITIAAVTAFLADTGVYLISPDVSRLSTERPGKTAFMEYRERQWQRQGVRKQISQQWTTLARISPYAVKAVIIAEDDKFWSHTGFDFEAIQRAAEKDIEKRKLRVGGSTISQQLAKNLYLSPSRSPIRKLKEAILTWRLERNLSKRRIIELYLNIAEWGDGIFGIEAASRHYWGKSAADLTPREAALLAVVLPSPLRYNPVKGGKYVTGRAEVIYEVMIKRGIVIPEYEETMNASRDAPTDQGQQEKPQVSVETAAPSAGEPGADAGARSAAEAPTTSR
jgi:monofunctional glycosyltransferase